MPLTHQQLTSLPPVTKPRKLFDGGGLYLELFPNNSKLWRLKYRFGGKEKRLALGAFPSITIKAARQQRDEAKQLLASGIDPSAHRQENKIARITASQNTFEALALEWYELKHRHEVVAEHADRNRRRLERHAFPILGLIPLEDIQPPKILTVLRRIEDKGHIETAHRVKALIGQVFRYGVATGRAERDPTADLKDALRPSRVKHHAAIVDPAEIGPLIRSIDGYSGQPATFCALRLAPLVLLRPGELRTARWADIDLESAVWQVTAKGGTPLLVPLSQQACSILLEMESISRHRSAFVFPGARSAARPMSNNTVNAALRRLGYDQNTMTGHGFRAMARTALVERLQFPVEIVEMQLGHRVRDVHGRAYNRTQWVDQRRLMLQAWADYLDKLKQDTASQTT